MEVALVRFIGAGLALVFEGFEETVPTGAVAGAERFVARAYADEGAVVIAALERITSEIWREWRIAKLPRAIAKEHLEKLPDLLDRYRVPQSQMIGAVAVARSAQRTGSQAPGHAGRVASTIVGELKNTDAFQDRSLNESIAYFFIDRLLSHLLKEPEVFAQLRPAFQAYLDDAPWEREAMEAEPDRRDLGDDASLAALAIEVPEPLPEDQSGDEAPAGVDAASLDDAAFVAASADEMVRLAALYRVPEPALSAFCRRAAAMGLDGFPARMEEVAAGLRNLLALMAEPASEPHDIDTRSTGEEARGKLAVGDPADCDRLLAAVESRLKRAAQGEFGNSSKLLTAAADVGAQRGLLAEIGFDWLAAAEFYGAAARCLPAADRKRRWRYLMSQALALERQGRDEHDTQALIGAAHVHSDAARLLSEQDAPADWALSHLQLGQLLLLLGKREKRTERFLAAALHFNPALDAFAALQDMDNWARSQLGLAEALAHQGQGQGDVELLSEAAVGYRAGLGVITAECLPDEWMAASYALGSTLLRLAQESGDVEPLEEAVTVMRAVIARSQEVVMEAATRGEIYAKLGHVLLALGAARGDLGLIADAAEAFEVAIGEEQAGAELSEAATAAALDALGSALLVLAEAAGDIDATFRAAEAKDAALSYYKSIGEDGLVESLTRELEEIVALLPDDAEGTCTSAGSVAQA